MEENLNIIKKIAFDYFDGGLSPEKEKMLFDFINENGQNLSLLRMWENEWLNRPDFGTPPLNEKWLEFERKKTNREKLRSIVPIKSSITRYISTAAAIVLIIITATFGMVRLNMLKDKPLQYYTIEAPLGQKSKIKLTDGSQVWLNSGSKLLYSEAFGKKNREVKLIGEAYFEVEKSSKQFIVKTAEYRIEVKGTKFNVTAYSEDDFSSTTLLEGIVEFHYNENKFYLKPGETLQLDKNSHEVTRYATESGNSVAWTENRFEYSNIHLHELLKRLSREYNHYRIR